jgi:error-prone DNA polymerase
VERQRGPFRSLADLLRLDAHLTELRRDAFTKAGATPIASLAQVKHGQRVKIGGLLVALQRPPTAKGFAFLAVEDPGGMVNVVSRAFENARHSVLWRRIPTILPAPT